MGAGQNGQADDVHVFLDGGLDDHLRCLAQAGVDDLHACVAQGTGDDLGAAVVAVQARLGHQDANLPAAMACPPFIAVAAGARIIHQQCCLCKADSTHSPDCDILEAGAGTMNEQTGLPILR